MTLIPKFNFQLHLKDRFLLLNKKKPLLTNKERNKKKRRNKKSKKVIHICLLLKVKYFRGMRNAYCFRSIYYQGLVWSRSQRRKHVKM